MKKRFGIVVLFLSLLVASDAAAQKPGYLGKQYMVGAEGAYGYTGIDFFPLNFHYGVFVEKVMARKFQLGLNFFMYNSRILGQNIFDTPKGSWERLKGNSILVKCRFYRGRETGAIAPIGKYIDLGFAYTTNRVVFPQEIIDAWSGSEPFPVLKGSFLLPHVGIGIQTVVFDCLALDTGLRAGIYPIPVTIENPRYKDELKSHVYRKNMVNFNVRVAYLF